MPERLVETKLNIFSSLVGPLKMCRGTVPRVWVWVGYGVVFTTEDLLFTPASPRH
jgi:hypothetical protein